MNAGAPIFVPRGISGTEREALQRQVERALMKLSCE
jgi:hypothetical protein